MATAVNDSMPLGWTVTKSKLLDGRHYYHHAASNTTQWHFPTLADQKRANGIAPPKYVTQSTQAMRLEKMRQKINDARSMRDLQSRTTPQSSSSSKRNRAGGSSSNDRAMQDRTSEFKNSLVLSPHDANINNNEYKHSSSSPIKSSKGLYSKNPASIMNPKKSFSFQPSSPIVIPKNENMAPSPIITSPSCLAIGKTRPGEVPSPVIIQLGSKGNEKKIRIKFSMKKQHDKTKHSTHNNDENCEECELDDIMCDCCQQLEYSDLKTCKSCSLKKCMDCIRNDKENKNFCVKCGERFS